MIQQNTLDLYKQAIRHNFNDVIDIRIPQFRGVNNNLMFVKTAYGDYVAKFSPRDIVLKNNVVSRIASEHGILVPTTSIGSYNDTVFEYYPMIKGETLYERMLDGMPKHAVRRAFLDMLTQFMYMENLPVDQLKTLKCARIHEAIYAQKHISINPITARLFAAMVRLLNQGPKQDTGLYHGDISPQNVIVDKNGKLISFIDIDNIAICNRDFAFRIIVNYWTQLGFKSSELYDQYEFLSKHPINRLRIESMRHAAHIGGKLFGKQKNR